MPTRTGSPGFALAVAVFALVLIAALLAGVFFAAYQELRVGRSAQGAERAFEAAESGLGAAVAAWDPAIHSVLDEGRSATFSGTLPRGTGAYAGTVTRLNRTLFLVQATGTDAGGSARRALSQIVRLAPPSLDLRAALTVAGRLDIGPSILVDGEDYSPEGWACPAPVAAIGVRIRDSGQISSGGCPVASCIRGDPAVRGDSTLGDSLARQADDASWTALVALAAKVYPESDGPVADIAPVGTATTCDSSVRSNWGDPASPPAIAGCAGYFPVIHAEGNLRVSGGSGQGILLVEGDMVVEGGFQFRGAVLVRGRLTMLGLGGRLWGAATAASVDLHPSGPTGTAEILFSSCAVRAALLQNASARPLAPRGWAELF